MGRQKQAETMSRQKVWVGRKNGWTLLYKPVHTSRSLLHKKKYEFYDKMLPNILCLKLRSASIDMKILSLAWIMKTVWPHYSDKISEFSFLNSISDLKSNGWTITDGYWFLVLFYKYMPSNTMVDFLLYFFQFFGPLLLVENTVHTSEMFFWNLWSNDPRSPCSNSNPLWCFFSVEIKQILELLVICGCLLILIIFWPFW